MTASVNYICFRGYTTLLSPIASVFTFSVHYGKVLTPKSVLFATLIKSFTNNYKIIPTANRLDCGISYATLQEILIEVAYHKIENVNQDQIALPDKCRKKTFTIFEEDKIGHRKISINEKTKQIIIKNNNNN